MPLSPVIAITYQNVPEIEKSFSIFAGQSEKIAVTCLLSVISMSHFEAGQDRDKVGQEASDGLYFGVVEDRGVSHGSAGTAGSALV